MNLVELKYCRYDTDRTILSPCGTMACIFTTPNGVKKPKILRISLVDAADYDRRIGYVTFCNAKHSIYFRRWQDSGKNHVEAHVRNMEETGAALADRLFAIAKALKK